MPGPAFRIEPARSPADLSDAARLLRAYADALGIDLAYQGFEAEVASLPGRYAPPAGTLLLARDAGGRPLGCVALRAIEPPGCCEMKRLYVAPRGRGLGIGRALVDAAIAEAARMDYREIRLDTLPSMAAAQALYERQGFTAIDPYYETTQPGTVFLARRIAP